MEVYIDKDINGIVVLIETPCNCGVEGCHYITYLREHHLPLRSNYVVASNGQGAYLNNWTFKTLTSKKAMLSLIQHGTRGTNGMVRI